VQSTDLPREEAPLRVGHDGEVPAVLGAQAGDAVGGAVGVEGIGLGGAVAVVHEPAAMQCDAVGNLRLQN